jgi:hypothetical protein
MSSQLTAETGSNPAHLWPGDWLFFGQQLASWQLCRPVYLNVTKATCINRSGSCYQCAPFELKARLLANENPFGPSPAAKKAIQDAIDKSYQYPL